MKTKQLILSHVAKGSEVVVTKIKEGSMSARLIKDKNIKIGTRLKVLSIDPLTLVAVRITDDWLWTGREILLNRAETDKIVVKYSNKP